MRECGSNHALLTAKEAISLWVLGARKVCNIRKKIPKKYPPTNQKLIIFVANRNYTKNFEYFLSFHFILHF